MRPLRSLLVLLAVVFLPLLAGCGSGVETGEAGGSIGDDAADSATEGMDDAETEDFEAGEEEEGEEEEN